jgi:hypothetical protein
MATVSQRPARVKPARTVRLAVPPSADNPFSIITITQGRKADDYIAQPIPSDWGTAFEVTKIFDPQQKVYQTLLDGARSSCTCLGHLHYGYCRHGEALTALRQHGKL